MSPLVQSAMRAEVEALLDSTGLLLDWRLLGTQTGTEVHTNLYVIRFRGHCHTRDLRVLYSELGPYGDPTILGLSHTSDNNILPFGQIDCDNVRRSIAAAALSREESQREAVLGRALGRVFAHELFHMMTGRSGHSRKGVFKASQRREDLTSARLEFETGELEELRQLARRIAGHKQN
ncbi:MAG: hypothetical protein JNK87_38985 [Bryobacterales bacterium]|nr:hypothetical protein [Bryobacterales bacterium]